jgi:outer membrane protein assembly factor BamB
LGLRVVGYLVPPLGFLGLWWRPARLRTKIVGSIGLILYSVLYAAVIVFLLIRFTGLQIEWRGGYLPALTYRKTRPDYDALERDRQKPLAASVRSGSEKAAYWTGFRGPKRDGHYEQEPIATRWPAEGLSPVWKQPVGGGYGSFAVAEGLAFTIEQRRENEALVAYDVQTGNEIWVHDWPGEFRDFYSEGGPRTTPAYSEGKVYALGALGTLHCVDAATGKLVWSREILAENHAGAPGYGVAASPLVTGDKLVVLSSAGREHSVLCYDKEDGNPLWSSLDDVTGYASPMLMKLDGEEQLVVCCEKRTVGLRPGDGKLLWEYPWHVKTDQLPIAQPVLIGSNGFMLSAGYFTGCAAVEIGKAENGFTARTLWKNSNMKNKFTSSVCWQDHIYGLDEDILTCLDAKTGARKWKDGRYGYGQVILASGHLIVLSGEGELALVEADPRAHVEIARFRAITGKTWNHPAIADGKLLVRNGAQMACFDLISHLR